MKPAPFQARLALENEENDLRLYVVRRSGWVRGRAHTQGACHLIRFRVFPRCGTDKPYGGASASLLFWFYGAVGVVGKPRFVNFSPPEGLLSI